MQNYNVTYSLTDGAGALVDITKNEIEEIATRAAEIVLQRSGIDPVDSKQTQADMIFLRHQRTTSERIGLAIRIGFYTTLVTGALSMLWLGFKSAMPGS